MERLTMSVQELSQQLGISKPKAYELVRSKGFPAIQIGRRIVIPTDGFKRWLIEQSNGRGSDRHQIE